MHGLHCRLCLLKSAGRQQRPGRRNRGQRYRSMTEASAFPLDGNRVFIAGHHGMVGHALVRRLEQEPVTLLAVPRSALDLTDLRAVEVWMQTSRPDVVIIAAAKVGGILANKTYPVDFLQENLLIQANVMRSAHHLDVRRLLFLGSSCIYPRDCPQPIKEEYLLTVPLEPTSDAYALAKIAGLRLVRAYREQNGRLWISCMPTNLYSPFDNFDPEASHVLPALLRQFHEAAAAGRPQKKQPEEEQASATGRPGHSTVVVWGTGNPRREFLHVDDLPTPAAIC
jgi:GDP-L-fucose synthase